MGAAIPLAGGVALGSGGGKNSGADRAAGRAATAQSRLAQQLVEQTDPLRELLTSQGEDFLRGGFDVTGLPQFRAGMDVIGEQFNRAEDAVIAGTPEGGALTAALANLERGRASNIAQLTGGLAETETNRALQLGTFGAAAGTQGLGNAAMLQAQRAAVEAQQNSAKSTGLGTAAGAALGSK